MIPGAIYKTTITGGLKDNDLLVVKCVCIEYDKDDNLFEFTGKVIRASGVYEKLWKLDEIADFHPELFEPLVSEVTLTLSDI